MTKTEPKVKLEFTDSELETLLSGLSLAEQDPLWQRHDERKHERGDEERAYRELRHLLDSGRRLIKTRARINERGPELGVETAEPQTAAITLDDHLLHWLLRCDAMLDFKYARDEVGEGADEESFSAALNRIAESRRDLPLSRKLDRAEGYFRAREEARRLEAELAGEHGF